MAEIRGCDLVVEYLIKEKVPYLFGYAGHGAVGLLDGVFNHQDELKIVFPRIESAAGYMADAYFRALWITSRRFELIIRSFAARSPRSIRFASSTSSAAVSSG